MHPEGNTPNNQSQCHTDQPTPGRAESHEAGVSSLGVSATTQSLIDLLRRRDAAGRAKYGTTLDRTDLTGAEWTQHAVEELLDAAGYLLSRQRTDDQASAPVGVEAVDAEAWIEVLELPEGFRVAEHLPGIWEYQFDIEDEADEDSDRKVSGASWNHPALAAIAAWGHAYHALAQQPAACDHERSHAAPWRCAKCGHRYDQQPAAVDEAMVERATTAFFTHPGRGVNGTDDAMRAALTAALAGQQQGDQA